MLDEQHPSLNPDSEQQLFEKLSMSAYDLAMLEYIRGDMRVLLKYEEQYKNKNIGS